MADFNDMASEKGGSDVEKWGPPEMHEYATDEIQTTEEKRRVNTLF